MDSALRDIKTVFPDNGPHYPLLGKKERRRLRQLYAEYVENSGRPLPEWKTAGFSTAQLESLHAAISELTEGGSLGKRRSKLNLATKQCPYCGFGEIKELDHHLQKSEFRCFSIFLLNLVPSCSKCNGHKPRKARSNPKKHHIHAYLEQVPESTFLAARIRWKKGGLSVAYTINKRKGMSDELVARLAQHLVDFKLNTRYPSQVNIYLTANITGLRLAHATGGGERVKQYLLETADANDVAFGTNDWRAALVRALAESKRFCNGGFETALGY